MNELYLNNLSQARAIIARYRWHLAIGSSVFVGLLWLASLKRPFTPITTCWRPDAWRHEPGLLETTIVGDLGTFVAYVWIPILAVALWWRLGRPLVALGALLAAGLFVLSCGSNHFDDVITSVVTPIYWFSAEKRVATAVISLGYAALLQFRWMPQILAFVQQARHDRAALQSALDAAEAARDVLRLSAEETFAANRENQRLREEAERAAAAASDARRLAEDREREAREALERERELSEKAAQQALELEEVNRKLAAQNDELQAHLSTIRLQQVAIQELSTPVIPFWREALLVPLIGVVDSTRAQQLEEQVLFSVTEHQAKTVIIDVTGVHVVDTAVAHALIRLNSAVRLLGAGCIITGIRGSVARTIVQLGIELDSVTTCGRLQDGVERVVTRHVRKYAKS